MSTNIIVKRTNATPPPPPPSPSPPPYCSGFLNSWLAGAVWVYNFQAVVTAATVVYSFLFCAPLAIYFVLRQFGVQTPLMTTVCIYGYSLQPFVLASGLCLIPVG
jgi:hypothetical protein